MDFRIQEESPDVLSKYGQVPIALEVKSRFRVELADNGLGGIRLVEEPVDPPYIKNMITPAAPSAGPGERGTSRGGLSSPHTGNKSASAGPLSPFTVKA